MTRCITRQCKNSVLGRTTLCFEHTSISEIRELITELFSVKAERDDLRDGNLKKFLAYSEILEALVELLKTHSELNQAEYNRNQSYNNTHPAYISEAKAIEVLEKHFGCSIVDILKCESEG